MKTICTALTAGFMALPGLSGVVLAQAPQAVPYPERLVEDWGQLMYCQEAYKAPPNRVRVYEYDQKQCQEAQQNIDSQLETYPENARAQLMSHAKNRAMVIRTNTRDVSKVIGACRQTCAQLASNIADTTEEAQP